MAEVVLGVSASIACYKSAELCSKLVQAGHGVSVVMTAAATRLVAPATFQNLSGRAVHVDMFDPSGDGPIEHIALADRAELIIVAPATAHSLAKLALGLAPDMLGTLLLAARSPVLVCPAMNPRMWAHPTVQVNLGLLRARGVHVLDPAEGRVACGHTGPGRLSEPSEIRARAVALLGGATPAPARRRFLEILTFDGEPSAAQRNAERSYRAALRARGQLEFCALKLEGDHFVASLLMAPDLEGAEALSAAGPLRQAGVAQARLEAFD